jgi:hypothetical protein
MKKHRKKQKKRVHMECHIFYYHVISVTNMIIAIYFGNLEKARSNTMPKAILELEMPENCAECPCKSTDVWGIRCRLIHIKSDKYSGMAEGYVYKRRPDCPLKPVEKGGAGE